MRDQDRLFCCQGWWKHQSARARIWVSCRDSGLRICLYCLLLLLIQSHSLLYDQLCFDAGPSCEVCFYSYLFGLFKQFSLVHFKCLHYIFYLPNKNASNPLSDTANSANANTSDRASSSSVSNNPLKGLSQESALKCKQLHDMGFPLERLGKACKSLGDDDQQMINGAFQMISFVCLLI